MATRGWRRDHADDEIPASHLDLVECPPVAALTTIMADGYPQTSVVWCKGRNLRANPRCSLLVVDPAKLGVAVVE